MRLADQNFLGIEPAHSRIDMMRNFRADDLEQRLVRFAIDIVTLIGQLPHNFQARHIASQLLRSGTAAAPNYVEARAAESRADFIHKLKIALKELNETRSWLEQIVANSLFSCDKMASIIAENQELCWIIAASIKTARRISSPI